MTADEAPRPGDWLVDLDGTRTVTHVRPRYICRYYTDQPYKYFYGNPPELLAPWRRMTPAEIDKFKRRAVFPSAP